MGVSTACIDDARERRFGELEADLAAAIRVEAAQELPGARARTDVKYHGMQAVYEKALWD